MAAFCRIRALSTSFNDTPLVASRPFDKLRDGFVISEGAAILVLEELEHARDRGAEIFGEVLGYGLSGDAHHITAPDENGDGAYRAMEAALREAHLSPEDVGYINAHATSTPLGDKAEARAIARLLGDHVHSACVSSTKGAVGHLIGAAGALESVFSLLACHTGLMPPSLNCENPDDDIEFQIVRPSAMEWKSNKKGRRIALTNSFGFGGTNGCLCLSNYIE